MSEWNHKDVWTRRGDHFAVEICRWSHGAFLGEERQVWNVYVYIYKTHPLYAKFKTTTSTNYRMKKMHGLEFHGGVTFFERTRAGSVKVGCDYVHAWDDKFERSETLDEAWEVKSDADLLWEFMLSKVTQ